MAAVKEGAALAGGVLRLDQGGGGAAIETRLPCGTSVGDLAGRTFLPGGGWRFSIPARGLNNVFRFHT